VGLVAEGGEEEERSGERETCGVGAERNPELAIGDGGGRRRLCRGRRRKIVGDAVPRVELKGVCVWAYGLTLRVEEVGLWRNTTTTMSLVFGL